MNEHKIHFYTSNAFTKKKRGGTPAGIVLDADALADAVKQKIAARVGLSETAFVQKSTVADIKTTFFTPTAEVDLCGHATIAVFSLLLELARIRAGKYSQATKAGILGVEVQHDGTVFMEQALPSFGKAIDAREVARSLGTNLDSLLPDLPVQIVSTGLSDIIIPVTSLRVLLSIKPDFDEIAAISKKYGVVGYHVFSLETKGRATAHCRNFGPLYGIPEEAATGTSSGALACYLFKHGKISGEEAQRLVFEQGYSMRRPSEILVRLDLKDNAIERVRVGGKAAAAEKLEISINQEDGQ